MHGRWHAIGGGQGFVLAESNDSVAIGKWMQNWTDLLEFEVIPVNNDEDVMKVLGADRTQLTRGGHGGRPARV